MPTLRPNLQTLYQQILSDITSGGSVIGIQAALLPVSVLGILGLANAKFISELYAFLDYVAKNSIPFSSEMEFLEAWAAFKGDARVVATTSSGSALFTGTPSTFITSGTNLVREDGFVYSTTSSVTTDVSGNATLPFTSVLAGSIVNADVGISLTLQLSISGINAAGTASTAITGGADAETDASLRTRMLKSFASPGPAANNTDFQNWALQVAGCTQAWATSLAPGQVTIYPMFDITESAFNGFPQGINGVSSFETRGAFTVATEDLASIANHIYDKQPVTMIIFAIAPVAQPINLTITNLSPNTTPIQDAISAAVATKFLNIRTPLGQTVYPSDIYSAIASVPGITRFDVTSPSAPVSISVGNLPTVGTTSFS